MLEDLGTSTQSAQTLCCKMVTETIRTTASDQTGDGFMPPVRGSLYISSPEWQVFENRSIVQNGCECEARLSELI